MARKSLGTTALVHILIMSQNPLSYFKWWKAYRIGKYAKVSWNQKNLLLCSSQIKQESTSYQLTFLSYKQLKYGHAWAYTKTMSNLTLILLQPLRWCCVDCVIHHERDVHEEHHSLYMQCEQAIVREMRAWSLLLLAATVWSFAHMPLGSSDRNNLHKFKGHKGSPNDF